MKSFYRILQTAIIVAFFHVGSYGQSFTYDEIIESLGSLNNEQAYSRLFEFRSQNPHVGSAYIQLGHVLEQLIGQIDPFREQSLMHYYIDNAIIFYDLFPHYLPANEVRRNRKYFANIPIEAAGLPFSNEGAIEYARRRVEHCKALKQALTSTFNALEKSKDHYNNCVRIFNTINNSYDNYNEALLKTDAKFLALIKELDTEFKATISSFEEYKKLQKEFPVGKYNQQYTLQPIKTFRLEGITNSDFLQDKFMLWDYGKWVADYRSIYEKDILGLRGEIVSIQKLFDDNLKTIANSDFSENLALKSFDEFFMFRLGRFDSNSLIRELFTYNDKRQNFMLSTKNPLNNPNDSSSTLINRKIRYYYRLAQDMQLAKKDLDAFHSAITSEKISRFNDFFSSHYEGEFGLSNYKKSQTLLLEKTFDQALDNLDNYLDNEKALKNTYITATGDRGIQISLIPNKPDTLPPANTYITEDIFYNQGVPQYVSGYQVRPRANVAFVAKIHPDQKVEWIKVIESDNPALNSQSRSSQRVLGFEQGVVALVSTSIKGNESLGGNVNDFLHTLVQLDTIGNVKRTSYIKSPFQPLMLMFDEINQVAHLAFGQKPDKESQFYNAISVCQIDSLGITNWDTDLNVNGYLAGLVRADNKYVAYLNYKEFDINGKKGTAGSNPADWSFLMVSISNQGTINSVKPVSAPESLYIDRVFSLSSNEVNLIGYAGFPDEAKGRLRYFVFSANGDLIFSNIEITP